MNGWDIWWALTFEQRDAIEQALFVIIWDTLEGNPALVKPFISEVQKIGTPLALAIATIVGDMIT